MHLFLPAFDGAPDPRPGNARRDLGDLCLIAVVPVLCGAVSCAGMAAFGQAKGHLFRDVPKHRPAGSLAGQRSG
ncbi:hypothetical protein [Mangrovicoccus ximenensis]|uniref:hypothetical protein n=1 Tax=Mangrovicoccus ximenensis TaxID=1911570 RepID=UPI000D3D6DB0|nr:hypothetical protein [Mangrovicoccus ximenensis]